MCILPVQLGPATGPAPSTLRQEGDQGLVLSARGHYIHCVQVYRKETRDWFSLQEVLYTLCTSLQKRPGTGSLSSPGSGVGPRGGRNNAGPGTLHHTTQHLSENKTRN